MTDIVDQLREGVWGRSRRADAVIQAVMQEGADEIERLRKDNAGLLILVDMTRDSSMGHQERSERLRAALHRISLASQNSGTTKEFLGREARVALGENSYD